MSGIYVALFNMNWWEGAELVHPAILLMLLLNAACFIYITDRLLTCCPTTTSEKGSLFV